MLQTEDWMSNIFKFCVGGLTDILCFKFSSYRSLINAYTKKKKGPLFNIFLSLNSLEFI